MLIRLRTSGQVITESEFRNNNPNTSFPSILTIDVLNSFDADPVLSGPQPSHTLYQYVIQDGVEEINNQWFTKFVVVDMTNEQIDNLNIQLKESNKTQAISLLAQTDWTEISSVSDASKPTYLLNVQDFINYRAQLRVIAINPPVIVDNWPPKPTEQWK